MKRLHFTTRLLILLLLVVLVIPVLTTLADPGSEAAVTHTGYQLTWWTVDNGGTTSASGGGYSLSGTIGQPDAAVWAGGVYVVSGGFWNGAGGIEYRIYMVLTSK